MVRRVVRRKIGTGVSFKKELISSIKKLKIDNLSEKKIEDILDAIKDTIVDKIRRKEEFNIVGIASVRIGTLKERKGMKIFGESKINLPERNVVRIKVSEVLKEIVRGER